MFLHYKSYHENSIFLQYVDKYNIKLVQVLLLFLLVIMLIQQFQFFSIYVLLKYIFQYVEVKHVCIYM